MPDFVRITDVAPRDGLQNEPRVIPTAEKARLVSLLCETGVDEIEVTSFVSPGWIPQLADAEDVLAAFAPPPPGRGSRASGEGGTPQAPDLPLPLHPDDHHERDPVTVERSRELRREMTYPERLLWSRLRGDRLMNLRFRRQHPIGPYIADFYCPAARLVIEVGGRTHRTPEAVEHDRRRDSWMRSQGIEVLRVTNDDIVQAVDAAAKRVVTAAAARAAQTGASGVPPPRLATDPLPKGGGVNRPIFSVLVPNEKGFDRALAVHRAGPPLKIAAFTAASETFSRKNINATIAESIDRFRAFVPRARAEGMPVRLYVSCAIACPFEGAIAPATVRGIVERLLELAPDDAARAALEIDLADTIGVAHPNDIHDLLREFDEPMRRAQITLHLHDTFARAASCVRAALDAGVRSFDASAGGLGGCPFAGTPTRRAPGNIATEILVDAVHSAGFRTNVDPDRLREASAFARSLASR